MCRWPSFRSAATGYGWNVQLLKPENFPKHSGVGSGHRELILLSHLSRPVA